MRFIKATKIPVISTTGREEKSHIQANNCVISTTDREEKSHEQANTCHFDDRQGGEIPCTSKYLSFRRPIGRRNPTLSPATQFNHVQSQSSPPRLLRYDKKKIFVISTTLPGMQAIGRNKSSPRIHSWVKEMK